MGSFPARAFIGVGSNIQPHRNVVAALEHLAETPGITLTGISTFYRTAALSDPGRTSTPPHRSDSEPDPDFLNGVLELETRLSAGELLDLLSGIETALGRTRTGNRYAPRPMDLDLLLYGRKEPSGPKWEKVGEDGRMTHRDIERRAFVAHPLMELAPELTLPPHGVPLRALAAGFQTPGGEAQEDLTHQLRTRFLQG